jgi:hypothetical protein
MTIDYFLSIFTIALPLTSACILFIGGILNLFEKMK